MKSFFSVLLGAVLMFSVTLRGANYEVGPGKPLANPNDVPWETLAAGDTVLIHWRPGPYFSKWVLCRQGTAAAPITVRGVPGPAGELPVIDGSQATTRSVLNYWNQPRGVIKIGGANVPADLTPEYIVIDSLDIRGARPPNTFYAANGASTAYPNNAAAIYIEKGSHITIRNCALHDSGNGLFTAFQSSDVLVERNHIYDNGNDGSIYEHNSYTAAAGITFQFNHYGPLRAGCLGNNLKDRSAGLVVRCNWIEGGNRQLDLVDGEDDPSIVSNPLYGRTFVYGNVLVEPDGAGNRQIVHYGGDSGNTAIYRKGTLYFYQNTIVSTRTDRTTVFRLSTNDEQCDCRNNIIYVSAGGNTLSLLDDTGRLLLTHNWLKPGWVQSFGGTSGTVVNDGSSLNSTSPAFLGEAVMNFRLAASSVCIDVGTNFNPDVLPRYAVTNVYVRHQGGERRRQDARLDLGAYEFSPWHDWLSGQFGSGYETSPAAAESADPDGDGIPNVLEYAFGLDPNTKSRAGLPVGVLQPAGNQASLMVAFHRRPAPSELVYDVQSSVNLASWMNGSAYSDSGGWTDGGETSVVSTGTNAVVKLNRDIGQRPVSFLRVRVRRE